MRNGDYITTYSGTPFYILDPVEEEVFETDIAHALSMMTRANGHLRHFYSVAQHCLNCMWEARARHYSPRVQLACLLHDASESYISDITRPVKHYMTGYHDIERNIQELIYHKFGLGDLTDDERAQLDEVDDALLYHEFKNLHRNPLPGPEPPIAIEHDFSFRPMDEVEQEYLVQLNELQALAHPLK